MPVQEHGARAILLLAMVLAIGDLGGFITLEATERFVGGAWMQPFAESFFRALEDPSPLRFEVWVARAMLATACVAVPALFVSTRWHDVANEGSVGASPRLLALRVFGSLFLLVGVALGAVGLLAHAHYGLAGDSPSMWPRFELCAHVMGPDRDTLVARSTYYVANSDGSFLFKFPADSALRDMRVFGARRADALVELKFNQDALKSVRFAERECLSATGDLAQGEMLLLTRTGRFATGEMHLECPTQGVAAHVRVVPGASDQMREKHGRESSMRLVGRLLTHAVCLLLAGLGLFVQGFGARADSGSRDTHAQWIPKIVPTVFLALPALFLAPKVVSPAFGYDRSYTPPHVTGCLHIARPKHAEAIGQPTSCSAGHRGNHDLVTLHFAHGSPVRELQIAVGQDDDRAVEAHFAPSYGHRLFFGRSQCSYYETNVETRSYFVNRVQVEHTSGDIHMSCPSLGFALHVSLEDC